MSRLIDLDELLSLGEASALLGVSATTLRHQVKHGRLAARLFGKTWITTKHEVERYRSENLGRAGRPPSAEHVAAKRLLSDG